MMTCRECERILLDAQRCKGGSRDPRYLAQMHLASCLSCKQRLSGVANVNAALRIFREASEAYQASAELERDLLAVFRERDTELVLHRTQESWHFSRWAVAALVIVAGLVGIAGMLAKLVPLVNENLPAVRSTQPLQAKSPSLKPLAKRKEPKRLHTARQRKVVAAKTDNERQATTDLVETMHHSPMQEEDVAATSRTQVTELEGGTVVRVTLPASSLGVIGWSVADATNRRVTADITVDPYGVVQRVNVVQPHPIPK